MVYRPFKNATKHTKEELLIALLGMVLQNCDIEEKSTRCEIDNLCISANEKATEILAKAGIITKHNDRCSRIENRVYEYYYKH